MLKLPRLERWLRSESGQGKALASILTEGIALPTTLHLCVLKEEVWLVLTKEPSEPTGTQETLRGGLDYIDVHKTVRPGPPGGTERAGIQ